MSGYPDGTGDLSWDFCRRKKTTRVDEDIQALVDERQEARKAKNFARADEIRDLLKARGHHTEGHAAGRTDHQGVSFAESCEGLTGNESRRYQRNQYDGTGVHGGCCIRAGGAGSK